VDDTLPTGDTSNGTTSTRDATSATNPTQSTRHATVAADLPTRPYEDATIDAAARLLAYAIAGGRIALGVTAMAAPGLASHLLAEPSERRPVLRMFTRLVGIRDLALGVATIDALRQPDQGDRTRRLLWLGVVCDLSDGAATIRQSGVPPRSRRLVTAVAWLGAAAGTWPALRLRRHR
jgi:hypothetical protein